jgi:nucleoside-diphosphate-sugar epimerase
VLPGVLSLVVLVLEHGGEQAHERRGVGKDYDGRDPINIGSGAEISIGQLAERIRGALGFTGEIEWNVSRPNGQPRRRLETSRALVQLGFEAVNRPGVHRDSRY